MSRLDGRVAIVTGAASGIGRAIAEEYLLEGAVVAAIDRNPEDQMELPFNTRLRRYTADITDYDRMKQICDSLLQELGRIDILVNNAAISAQDGELLDSTLEDWRRVNQVNLEAVYVLSKLVAEPMVRQQNGRIVNIASIQGFMSSGRKGSYNAAKAGVLGLTHSMAVELGKHNILVNAIAPGFIRTAMSIRPDGTDETETAEFKNGFLESGRIPLGRAGLAQDVAGAALFLASDDCRYLTGQTIVVDGGLSITI
jgi:3-oxoacyl-[acyl-carrier protein] reductase